MERPNGKQRSAENMTTSSSLLHLAKHSSELFFIYNLTNRRFTYFNQTCTEFFGLRKTDVRSEVLLDMVHPDDKEYLVSKIRACIAGQTVANVECRINREANKRWLKITPFIYKKNGERLLIGQAEDVTAIKKNTEVLNNHNNKQNSILNILAHDLAGPIGNVQSLCTLLGRETEYLNNSKINQYINMMSKISKNNIKLIRDFLNQEFLESSSVKLKKKRVELVRIVRTITEEYFGLENELKINFSLHANKEMIYVEIDEDKFMQAINNLMSNAFKFTPDGGAISIDINENENSVLISISDTGIGIAEKYHATLFDKFTAARRSGLKGEYSTGLGMSIIKTIVEWHEGTIWFKSEENKGTTFYIKLPKNLEKRTLDEEPTEPFQRSKNIREKG